MILFTNGNDNVSSLVGQALIVGVANDTSGALDLLKRGDIDLIVREDHVKHVFSKLNKGDVIQYNTEEKTTVEDLLVAIKLPTHLKGFKYVLEAIKIMDEHEDYSDIRVTKDLYPVIASRFSTTASRVERAIRHLVNIRWVRIPSFHLKDIFGATKEDHHPTNYEFIVGLYRYIKRKK